MTVSCIGLFCESIREEKGGQDTLVGILADNLAVPTFPGTLASMSIYVRVAFDPNHSPGPIAFELLNVDDTSIAEMKFEKALVDGSTAETLVQHHPLVSLIGRLNIGNIRIPHAGRMRLYAVITGQRRLVGALNFVLIEPPLTSQ